jgi:hypothetical protein
MNDITDLLNAPIDTPLPRELLICFPEKYHSAMSTINESLQPHKSDIAKNILFTLLPEQMKPLNILLPNDSRKAICGFREKHEHSRCRSCPPAEIPALSYWLMHVVSPYGFRDMKYIYIIVVESPDGPTYYAATKHISKAYKVKNILECMWIVFSLVQYIEMINYITDDFFLRFLRKFPFETSLKRTPSNNQVLKLINYEKQSYNFPAGAEWSRRFNQVATTDNYPVHPTIVQLVNEYIHNRLPQETSGVQEPPVHLFVSALVDFGLKKCHLTEIFHVAFQKK